MRTQEPSAEGAEAYARPMAHSTQTPQLTVSEARDEDSPRREHEPDRRSRHLDLRQAASVSALEGGYGGGIERKSQLLELERTHLADAG